MSQGELILTPEQTRRLGRVLGQSFADPGMAPLRKLWDRIVAGRTANRLAAGAPAPTREAFDYLRGRFWRAVRRDKEASDFIESLGLVLDRTPGRETTIPYVQLRSVDRVGITIDHIDELQRGSANVNLSDNLRLSFWRENTYNLRVLNTKDPFINPPNRDRLSRIDDLVTPTQVPDE